jgi:DNA polymerase-3 subunit alpha
MLLNCHTYYSLRYGTFSVEELMKEVVQKGYTEFVLTDINNTSAVLDTVRRAHEFNLKPIVGIDFRNGVQQQYVGIARNNEGFSELNKHLSDHLHQEGAFEPVAPVFNNAYVIYPFKMYKGWALRENEFIGISAKELQYLPFSLWRNQLKKFVVLQPASFAGKRHFNAHRLLRAIDNNTILSKLPPEEVGKEEENIFIREELYAAFALYPQMVANTERILRDCSIGFEYGKLANKNLKTYTGSIPCDLTLLQRECEEGLLYRYGKNIDPKISMRLEKEIDVIVQKDFISYYLVNWNITQYAIKKGYYYVGRGSGANSLVAYLLRITDVDPIELDLYFERFINIYRANAPDFDIDFSWADRDDITRHIFDTFGKNGGVALLGAYNTFKHDAVIRQLGKVFGLPPADIERLQQTDRYPDIDKLGQQVLRYGELIRNFPSHLSIHSSGIIISEKPINTYCATFLPPKGYATTQFSMLEAEDVGLFKFDILSQRGLGKIKNCLEIVKDNKGEEIDIHDIPKFKQDDPIKELLKVGNTIGCFYVESPAMRMLLAKLQADDYLRLVAASSIIRPGVAKSGMMGEYIDRYRKKERREKARAELPELYDLLEETYGVMVYQEDVIKVAHYFADLTLAEADVLRRGMSWKFKERNEFSKVQDKFFENCKKRKHNPEVVSRTWKQIETFANFAFSKGHSASYAVESYQALFLKAYHPLEYMVATLNNGGGFYRKELYIHEARLHGATIVRPDINNSGGLCTIQGNTIYLGLAMIEGMEQETILQIEKERKEHGPFTSLENFVKRTPLSIEQMRTLVRAGTFEFTGRGKKELLWEVHTLVQPAKKTTPRAELFETPVRKWKLPLLTESPIDDAFNDLELFGFTLCSPFKLLRDQTPIDLKAADLKNHINQKVCILGYFITRKDTATSGGEKMHFGTFIDIDGRWIDTVHFPPSAREYPFVGPGCYELHGKVTQAYDFITLEVEWMMHLPMIDREMMRAGDEEQMGLGNIGVGTA